MAFLVILAIFACVFSQIIDEDFEGKEEDKN